MQHFDAHLVSYFTPEMCRKADLLSGGKNRANMVRDLIYADLMSAFSEGSDARDAALRLYRQPRRFLYPSGRPIKFAVTQEMRDLALLRCQFLGFRQTDYPAALVARAYHREFGTEKVLGPVPPGHHRTPRPTKGEPHVQPKTGLYLAQR